MNDQLTAHYLANRYPNKAIVTFNCGHAGKKSKHHPDYSKPFEVELLCSKCHGKRPQKIRKTYKTRKLIVPDISPVVSAMRLYTEKLEAERDRLKLSKTRFARYIGMSVSAYCRMLDGASTKITTITRIADALHYDPKDLLTN